MAEFLLGLALGVLTAVMWIDVNVTPAEADRAAEVCIDNGGVKYFNIDVSNSVVYCNNGAIFKLKQN
ncbi:hypothetical protein QE320_gp121 [Pseudomonas phage EM]|uniref:Uncharacterized protein n=1 Tax=Pseudomonas phage EM TaxID=2936914 RepID=A0AAE9HG59_9CAUD|nr:hypothetical protein QE320_gp121 [Pseudomonas phage EM]UPW35933.1 hypothetical protein EM_148 [Pseudomonas phage EM]